VHDAVANNADSEGYADRMRRVTCCCRCRRETCWRRRPHPDPLPLPCEAPRILFGYWMPLGALMLAKAFPS
jgi:hypothetical protein